MEDIGELYKRIKIEAIKALSFNIFLNAAIIFLAFNFVLSFFGIPYTISLIPAVAYFLKRIVSSIKEFDLDEYKEKNDELKHIVNLAEKSAKDKHALSDTRFSTLVDRTKSALLFNLITSRRVREKIYVIVVLALLTVLLGSFNIYPTKISFSLDQPLDLTRPSLWGQVWQRVQIETPEFATCNDELNYTRGEWVDCEAQLQQTQDELTQTKAELEAANEQLEEVRAELSDTEASLESEYVEISSYNRCVLDLEEAQSDYRLCREERSALSVENSNLRSELDECRGDLAAC